MKIAIKAILLIAVLGYIIFAISTMSSDQSDRICKGYEVILEESENGNSISKSHIENIVTKTNCSIEGVAINNIDAHQIESRILESPYVDSVVCYYTPDNLMCIRVFARTPILHVITNSGDSYYMDINGNDMPTDGILMDVCLATGNFSKQYAREHLLEIATYINTHSPWDKDIQQIHVKDEKHIELIPLTGNHTIIVGDPTGIEEKMNKLSIFYKEGLDKTGWNKYQTINLNFADQIVCTKRKKR